MKSSRRRKVLNHFSGLLLFAFIFINAFSAFAGPGKTTYQAKIVKPDGYPLEATSVNFKFTILDPAGSCILYSETYSSVNMSSTGGLISFALGSGVKTYPASATTFEQVFSNITPSLSCDTGGPASFTPAVSDIRKIVMQFHDGSGWQTLPAMSINAVPYAMYANEATKLNGLTSSDFVQLSTVPTCTTSEALRYTGGGFTCVAVGNSVTSGTVNTALGYTPADGASVTALSSSLTTTNSNVSSVSSTVFSVSSTVTSLQNSVAASFAAITSSQWTTSGTNIFYNTGNIGIGTSAPSFSLDVNGKARTSAVIAGAPGSLIFENIHTFETPSSNALTAYGIRLSNTTTAKSANIGLTVSNASAYGELNDSLYFESPADFAFRTGSSNNVVVKSTGKVGIGTTTPAAALDVSGGVRIGTESTTCAPALAGTLRYNASNVEYCNGTSWQAFGVSGAGLQSFNGSTSGTQSFATGTGGTAPNIVTANGVHTLNIPLAASTGSVTAGLISNTDYTTFTNKITSSAASIAQVLGYVPADNAASGTYAQKANNLSDLTNVATARTNLGLGTFATANSIDLGSASATGTLAIARLPSFIGDATIAAASNTIILSNSGVAAGTYTKVTVDSKGRVTSSSALASSDVTTALGYTPASATASTQWTTSGSDIYYNTGNVGIGIVNPAAPLDVKQTAVLGGTAGNNILVMRTQSAGGSGGNNVHHNEWRVRRAAGTDWITHKIHDAISVDASYLTPGTDTRTFWERDPQNDIQSWGTGAFTYLSINAGNVGIGTTTPTSKLHVQDGAAVIKGTGSTLTVKKGFGSPNTLSAESVASFDNESGSGVAVNFFGNSGQGASIYMGDTAIPQQGIIKYFVNSAIPTNQYMSFSTSSTERLRISYVGNVGIGTTNPTAKLHLEAGTTSVAPFKFTSGTLLTSPQSGTIEYDGSNFYITDSTNTRRAIAANTNPGTYDNVSNINSSGNITMTPTGSVVVSSTTASTNSSTGALVVKGGLGVAGDIYTSGTIVTSSNIQGVSVTATSGMISPYIVGSVNSGGSLTLESTTHAAKGNVLLAPNGGNVGIGTTNPSSQLHVYKNTVGPLGSALEHTSGTAAQYILGSGGSYIGYLSTQPLYIGTTTANMAAISAKMTLDASGNVGIGTTTPNSELQVASDEASGFTRIETTNLDGASADKRLGLTAYGSSAGGYPDSVALESTGASNFILHHAGQARLAINSAGNIGIGTTTPDHKMRVVGKIKVGTETDNVSPNGQSDVNDVFELVSPNAASAPAMSFHHRGLHTVQISGFGTSVTNQGLRIKSGPGEQPAQLHVEGKVGIGMSAPTQALHVSGSVQVDGDIYGGKYGGTRGIWRFSTTDPNYGIFYTEASPDIISFSPNGGGSATPAMAIVGTSVGIGTTTPSSKLSVVTSTPSGVGSLPSGVTALFESNGDNLLAFNNTADNGTWSGMVFNDNNQGGYVAFKNWPDDYLHLGGYTGVQIEAGTQGFGAKSVVATFNSSGNVGIGTSAPTQKLDVVGTVKATAFAGDGSQLTNIPGSAIQYNEWSSGYAGGAVAWSSYSYGMSGWQDYTGTATGLSNFWTGWTTRNGATGAQIAVNWNVEAGSTGGVKVRAKDDTSGNWGTWRDLAFTDASVQKSGDSMTGSLMVGSASAPSYTLDVNGDIRITGTPWRAGGDIAWTVPSDARLKNVKRSYNRGLKEILNIGTIIYTYKKDNVKQIDPTKEFTGVLAQNVQENIPEAVKEDKDGFLSLNTTPIFWAMINAIKDLYHEITGVQREIASLKEENKTKDQEIKELKERLERIEKSLLGQPQK